MSTWWEVSSIVQWIVILVLGAMNVVLFRQLGIMIMGSQRGIEISGIPVGRKVPQESLETAGQAEWAPARWLGEKYVMFFAGTYCSECAGLMPVLRELAGGGLRLAVMMFHNGPEDLREYLAEHDVPGVVIPTTQKLGHHFDVVAVPYAYVIGEQGEVMKKGLVGGRELAEFGEVCGVRIPAAGPGPGRDGRLLLADLSAGNGGHGHDHGQ